MQFVKLNFTDNILWADCNVGATNPEESGDYYGFLNDESSFNPPIGYNIPTIEDIQNLWQNHERTFEIINGVRGIRFTGDLKHSIFMPFCGYRDGNYGDILMKNNLIGFWQAYSDNTERVSADQVWSIGEEFCNITPLDPYINYLKMPVRFVSEGVH